MRALAAAGVLAALLTAGCVEMPAPSQEASMLSGGFVQAEAFCAKASAMYAVDDMLVRSHQQAGRLLVHAGGVNESGPFAPGRMEAHLGDAVEVAFELEASGVNLSDVQARVKSEDIPGEADLAEPGTVHVDALATGARERVAFHLAVHPDARANTTMLVDLCALGHLPDANDTGEWGEVQVRLLAAPAHAAG